MESVEGFLETSNAVLHYVKYGNGPSIFICFHGYGQNNTAFKKFQLNLFPESTFYSFDLFFHGKSTLLKNYTLNKIDIATLLRIFFMKEKINVKFSIIAYSLGGLLSLVCLEEFPDNISTMILLAPEGFKKNFWYSFFTFNSITRKILKIAIRNYSILFTFIKFISILKIIQKRFARYLVHNLSNQEKRERLYNTWISFRKIKFDKIQIVHLSLQL